MCRYTPYFASYLWVQEMRIFDTLYFTTHSSDHFIQGHSHRSLFGVEFFIRFGRMNIDKWIEQLKSGNCISEPDLKKLCIHVS